MPRFGSKQIDFARNKLDVETKSVANNSALLVFGGHSHTCMWHTVYFSTHTKSCSESKRSLLLLVSFGQFSDCSTPVAHRLDFIIQKVATAPPPPPPSSTIMSMNRRRQAVFWKLLKDPSAQMRDRRSVSRFLEGMEDFDRKDDLLNKLSDQRLAGSKRIGEVLGFMDYASIQDVEFILVRMLDIVITKETSMPLHAHARDKVLRMIFHVPNLLEMLETTASLLPGAAANSICLFLAEVSRSALDARRHRSVIAMAKQFQSRNDVPSARTLASLVLVDDSVVESSRVRNQVAGPTEGRTPAMWVSDTRLPGDRHDNDHLNFRNIRIVPTAGELKCEERSWLPLASGENDFIEDPVTRIISNNFRLLREDALYTMKERINENYRPWTNARIVDLDISVKRGLISFIVQCDHRGQGKIDWSKSKMMNRDAVVAFCQNGEPKMIGTICLRDLKLLQHEDGPRIGVSFDVDGDHFVEALDHYAHNTMILHARKSSETAEGQSKASKKKRRKICLERLKSYDLIEVSSSFFSYRPVLATLQEMTDLPFAEEVCIERIGTEPTNRPPSYVPARLVTPNDAICNGFAFDVGSVSTEEITSNTTLDESQANALVHAFRNRVALIQGPPGCGKTFIGALLSTMIRQNTDASILCLCYTNHALDQFLEHMLDAGEQKIVRIGGRTKSERISRYQLHDLARAKATQRASATRGIKAVDAQLYELQRCLDTKIQSMKDTVGWDSPNGGVSEYLLDEGQEDTHRCFTLDGSEDGFQIIGPNSKPLRDGDLWNIWSTGEPFPEMLVPHLQDDIEVGVFQRVWNSTLEERLDWIELWTKDIVSFDQQDLVAQVRRFSDLCCEREHIKQQEGLEILANARIIGATTTGAAQFKHLLAARKPGIIVVEEAGEVLEAHVLSALQADSTQHLILIGDHLQLRPKLESHSLTSVSGKGYNLDCSLFERLIAAGIPSAQLEVQHRMRPEISQFIRQQTYPSLVDHDSVTRFPPLKGVQQNVVFFDHDFREDHDTDDAEERLSKSKTNQVEARLCVEVARFLLMQNYAPERITILTPYLGQLLSLLQLVQSELKEVSALVSDRDSRDMDELQEGQLDFRSNDASSKKTLRCSTIDNFQGEESDIILISLTRSNKRGDIGFLKEAQRVNVLMSRARLGMVLLGNSKTFLSSSTGSQIWQPIIEHLKSRGHFLRGLPTYCQHHPNDQVILTSIDDFRLHRPNGGCCKKCNFRMECGHVCPLTCHSFDPEHESVQLTCRNACKRVPPECPLGHGCVRLCKEKCGPCTWEMGPFTLVGCGHELASVTCHDIRNEDARSELAKRCKQKVLFEFDCGHKTSTTCANTKMEIPFCSEVCFGTVDSCGHQCDNTCGNCDGKHGCKKTCERQLFCGHTCGRPCHEGKDCPPCDMKCDVSCAHSSCPKNCKQLCSSCVEPCGWFCQHKGNCELVCGAPCSRLPCNERCNKLLNCGHRCPSLCGEACPDDRYCQECCPASQKNHVVDLVMLSTYADHSLDDDPIIVLPCGHFYTVFSLDGHLGMDEVYIREEQQSNQFIELKSFHEATSISEKPTTCPDCRSIVHSIYRYGRILRLSELRSLERKFLMSIQGELTAYARKLDIDNGDRKALLKKLLDLAKRIRKSPMSKVYEACSDRSVLEVPVPPQQQLIQTLGLIGRLCTLLAEEKYDANYQDAEKYFREAIQHADSSKSTRMGGTLRLHLCNLLVHPKWDHNLNKNESEESIELLDWVIERPELLGGMADEANRMKRDILENRQDKVLLAIVNAVQQQQRGGYDYGGPWSGHWYECPNGHPYFIGECGGAMQTATCLDCGEQIGGGSHRLLGTNRQASNLVAAVERARAT